MKSETSVFAMLRRDAAKEVGLRCNVDDALPIADAFLQLTAVSISRRVREEWSLSKDADRNVSVS